MNQLFSISCSVEEANRRAMNLLRFQMPPIALGNHALRAKFLSAFFCFPSLFVSAIPRINCRLLANEKTDSEELVSRPYQAQ